MSDRPARVRLMLDSGSFLGGLQSVSAQVSRLGRGMGGALNAGVERFGERLKDTSAKVKEFAGMAIGLAGGFGIFEASRAAIGIQDRYLTIAQAMSRASGEAVRWQDVQQSVEAAATLHRRTSEEIVAGFDAVREKSGEALLAAQSLGILGEAMNATGKSSEEFGAIIGSLRKKFGISELGELKSALLSIFEATKGGKIRFEELSEDLDELGSIAGAAGLTGITGFRKALGLAAAVAPQVNQSISEVLTGMDQLTEKLRQQPVVEGLAKAGGVAGKRFFEDFLAQPDAFARLRTLLEASARKGKLGKLRKEAIEVEFTGREERAAFQSLAKPFMEAFAAARASGKNAKEATVAATAAFDASVARLGTATSTWESIQRDAAERASGTAAKLRNAQEVWEQAFRRPEMIGAMNQLADQLPKLARGLADLVGWASNNPWQAVPTMLGAEIVKDVASAGIGAAVQRTLTEGLTTGVSKLGAGGLAFTVGMATFAITKALIEAHYAEKAEKQRKKAVADATAGATLANARTELATTGTLSPETRAKVKAALKTEEEISRGVRPVEPGTRAVLTPLGKRETWTVSGRRRGQQSQTAESAYQTAEELRGQLLGPGWEPESVLASRRARREETFSFAPEPTRANGKAINEDTDARKGSAKAADELARAMQRATREADRFQLPGARGGGGNGLPPPAPRTPGYAPR
jgi:hypothetical protein